MEQFSAGKFKAIKKNYFAIVKLIGQYIRNYLQSSDKKYIIACSIFCAGLIFLNYQFHLDKLIGKNNPFPVKLLVWSMVFMVAFGIPLFLYRFCHAAKPPLPASFYQLFFLATLLFAFKYTARFNFTFTSIPDMNIFWNKVLYWPVLLLIVFTCLLIIHKKILHEESILGTRAGIGNWQPYLLMLLLMLPLIGFAGTQPDFQAMYPKLKTIAPAGDITQLSPWQTILFELGYGSDFLSIELFFRGFLVLAFAKWLGKDAILPVAIFYCSIHFGKPIGECISSYFGGILLGIVVYNTRSIWGGLVVHLGIAWMMEGAGILLK